MLTKLSAEAKLALLGIVSLAGNTALIAVLPSVLPHAAVEVLFLVFNFAQLVYAFRNPSYTVHLIQTGQLKVPPAGAGTQSIPPPPTTNQVLAWLQPFLSKLIGLIEAHPLATLIVVALVVALPYISAPVLIIILLAAGFLWYTSSR